MRRFLILTAALCAVTTSSATDVIQSKQPGNASSATNAPASSPPEEKACDDGNADAAQRNSQSRGVTDKNAYVLRECYD